GAWKNAGAALSRLGARFARPALGLAKTIFQELTVVIDGLGERLGPLADGFASLVDGMNLEGAGERILGFFDSISEGGFGGLAESLISGLSSAVSAAVGWLASGGLQSIFTTISEARAGFMTSMLDAAPGLLDGLLSIVPQLIEGVSILVQNVVEFLGREAPAIVTGALTLLSGLVTAVGEILPQIAEALTSLLPQIAEVLI